MRKNIPLILSLGIVLGLNLYFRSFPINFPHLKKEAKLAVEKSIQNAAIQDVQKKFPQFYPTAKDKIVKARMAEYKKANRAAVKREIHNTYLRLKDRFQDDNGQTYLFELDCWHWGRYVENVIKYGHPGDEVIYGRQWDLFMLAPWGMFLHWEQFLYYFTAYIYKIFNFVKPVPLYTFLFYVPLLFSAIFIVVLYMFSFRLSGYIGATISSLFIGLSPIFLHRSCAGWFDKDVLNLLFPILIVWTYILGVVSPSFRRKVLWILFSSFWVWLFCFNWTHWWFIFFIIIIYEAMTLAYFVVASFYGMKKRPSGQEIHDDTGVDIAQRISPGQTQENLRLLKQHAVSLSLFLLFSFLLIMFFAGAKPLEVLYFQTKQALILNKPLVSSIWPNVHYTVGELRKVGIRSIAGSLGGMTVFISSLLGMAVIIIRALWIRTYDSFKRTGIIILVIWFIAMFFGSLRGVRFVVFTLVPVGISLGWILNEIYENL